MSESYYKLSIPKFKQPEQKQLYTPIRMAVPERKPVALFTWNIMIRETIDNLSNDEREILDNVFKEADKEYLNGEKGEFQGYTDDILNENEQKNFKQILQEKHPKIFAVVNKFLESLKTKSDAEKIAHNFSLPYNNGSEPSENYYNYCLADLNNDNLLSVANKYLSTNLLYEIYADANRRANAITRERDKYDSDEYYQELQNDTIKQREQGTKDLKILKEKYQDFANHLLQVARKNKIYSSDYQRDLEKAIENDDIKNLTIAVQRLANRIQITLDKNKELNASKRAAEMKDPNGQIDESFAQSYEGTCWFLSALKSMCGNKDILNRINEMIKVNKEDGIIKSVTVKIQEKDYTIDYEHLKNANEYATGDLDVRALEMAVNQYMHENNTASGDISMGGQQKDAYYILFGKDNVEINEYKNKENQFEPEKYLKMLKECSDNSQISNICIHAYHPYFDDQSKYYAFDENGKQVELPFAHGYTYSRIDSEFYYFTNPHSPEKELHIPLKDFAKTFDEAITVKIKNF